MMDKTFDPAAVEARIAARWEEAGAFKAGREDRKGLWYAYSADGGRTYSAPVSLAAGIPPSRVELAAQGESVLAAWDAGGRPAAVQVARIEGEVRIVRFRTVEGRMPALDASGDAAVLAWHDHSTVRLARLQSRSALMGW